MQKNRKLLIYLGIAAGIFGVALAYFTGDAEPWGTIGGVISALGLSLALFTGSSKKE
jgi:hypothetical protein